VLHRERIALRVIERDGDQEENSQESDCHNSVTQQFALMSFRSAWLSDQSTFDGFAHTGLLDTSSHWNVHWGPLLSYIVIDGSNAGEVVGSSSKGSPEVTEPAAAACLL
jgi:hypothetical protein